MEESLKLVTPLRELAKACREGDHETVKSILEKGVDPKMTAQVDSDEYSGLHLAIDCKDSEKALKTIEVLLEKDPTLISLPTKTLSLFPLHVAADAHAHNPTIHTKIVQLLIDQGADVNATDSTGYTPLYYTVNGINTDMPPPNLEVVKVFVKAGANLNQITNKGLTILKKMKKMHSKWYAENEAALKELSAPQKIA